jgi:hypothetical protein
VLLDRKQFTFYRSYYEAVRELPKKEQTAVVLAICAYALDEEEPKLTGTAKAIFSLIRPTLDTSRRKAEIGKRGGEAKQTESKTEAKAKQTAREKENKKENEIEKELENECYITPKPPTGRFAPPSVEQVAEYCRERGNGVDAQLFVDHYTANGWKVSGKTPMKDWKASVRTWEKNGFSGQKKPSKSTNNMVGADFGASNERIRKQSDWLDEFLAGQEEGA